MSVLDEKHGINEVWPYMNERMSSDLCIGTV